MATSATAIHKSGFELEYAAVRNEILKRIELRHQIVAVTLTLAGVFLGIGLTKELVALVYPTLAAFLALAWAQNEFRIKFAANHIRNNIEPSVPGLSWETIAQRERDDESSDLGSWSVIVLSHGGIFFFTQVMAIVIEVSKMTPFVPLKWLLLGFDVVGVFVVIWVALKTGGKIKKRT